MLLSQLGYGRSEVRGEPERLPAGCETDSPNYARWGLSLATAALRRAAP